MAIDRKTHSSNQATIEDVVERAGPSDCSEEFETGSRPFVLLAWQRDLVKLGH